MTNNNFRLESGREYSLMQLFNGKNRIVIPDLQRDYCWGDKAWNKDENNYKELVSDFIDNLISSFSEKPNDNLTLGLIYGYENPHFTIQLCDGQQRLTTLFLLIGMINRRTENYNFKELLITKTELLDDKEPNLQYSIRESTLYFLSDLVCEFFLDKDLKVADINKQDWYFKEYDLDASIKSMLSAIEKIDSKLINIDCLAFGEFIVNNLQMLYYDMGHRTRGEETFVVINTTGEPLTATENLKPILLGEIKDSETRKKTSIEWEDREEWFWQNKRNNEHSSDEALKDFFVWYWQIQLLQEQSWTAKEPKPLDPKGLFQKKPIVAEDQEENPDLSNWDLSRNLDTVHKYFIALKLLVEKSKEDVIANILKTILNEEVSLSWYRSSKVSLDIVLPLIVYSEKFGCDNIYPFIRRLRKNYFDNKLDKRRSNYIDWRHIVQIIDFSEKENEVLVFDTLLRSSEFKKISNVSLNEWYNQDEKQKDLLKIDHRDEIELWEDHDELFGDLSIFLRVSSNVSMDYNTTRQLYQSFSILSDCLKEEKSKSHPKLSNYFRLYKILIGYPSIGHIDYCSWDMEGAWFSWRDVKSNDFQKYLYDEKIISLIKTLPSNLEYELENRIKAIVQETSLIELNDDNFNVVKHLKAWLFIKVLYANKKNELLAFYDRNGIASYKKGEKNKLNKEIAFSLANSICGYAIKNPANRIDYAGEVFWGKPHCIDTSIGESISYSDFFNRNSKSISEAQIACISNEIDILIKSFMSSN